MNFLLDTNVVSEWTKSNPNHRVIDWAAAADEDRVFISVVTLAELHHGIERLAPGNRRHRLNNWLHQGLLLRFEGRILSIDGKAEAWGKIIARGEALGQPIHAMDGFIAATAQLHGLTLVTRNVSDFEYLIDLIFNPWNTADNA